MTGKASSSHEDGQVTFDTISELRQIKKALEASKKFHWTESFRTLTPIGLFIAAFFLNTFSGDINSLKIDLKDMRVEVSHHLQNAELHIPRSTVVSRDEFVLYQSMRDKQVADIKDGLCRIERFIINTPND